MSGFLSTSGQHVTTAALWLCVRVRGRGRVRVCRHVFGAASEHVTAELFLFLQLSRLIHNKTSRTADKHSAPVVSGET